MARKTTTISNAKLSRRGLLGAALCAAGALPIVGTVIVTGEARAQAKMPKSAVAYQDHPKGSQDCSNCALFQPPSACKNVAGEVSAKGWCSIWVKK
jgi:hypothetical protein